MATFSLQSSDKPVLMDIVFGKAVDIYLEFDALLVHPDWSSVADCAGSGEVHFETTVRLVLDNRLQ